MYKNITPPHHLNLCKTVLCTLFCITLIFSFTSCGNLNLPKKPSETGSFSFVLSDDILAHLEDAIGSTGSTASARSAVTPLITATVSLDKTSGGQLVDPVTVSGTLEELNGRVIEIKNVTLNTPFIVSMVIKVDNKEILTGTSDTITLTSTAPTDVTISLKLSDSLSSAEKEEAALWGTWTFDYGYNQDLWADDLITFNIDGTFDTHHINQDYAEWDKGTYSIGYDNLHNMILTLNITKYSDDWCSTWHDVNITNYYYLDYDSDELSLSRIKRDQSATDGPIEYFDPPIYNHYYRVKNGNREQLENATWNAVKSNDYWEEHTCTWAFNTDGTMVNTFDGSPSDAIWEIIQEDGRTLLYVKVTWNPDYQEWWYDYTSLGPDLIHVKAVKHTTNGIEDENDADSYYYRYIPLVKYTYHWKVSDDTTYTFYDYWPKGKEYTTFDSSKVNYIAGVPQQYLEQQILGIYTSEAMTGDPVKKISAAANTDDQEFWVQWGLKAHHNGTETEFCHSTSIPASDVFPTLTFSEDDTIAIHFEADLSKDIDGWTQIKIWPEEWGDPIAFGEVKVHTTGRHLSETYLLKTTEASGENMSFEYVYNQETGPVVFSNWKLIILDESNSYTINYHFGDLTYSELAYTGSDRKLPTDMMYFEQFNGDIAHNLECVKWCEDSNLSTSIDKYTKGAVDPGTAKHVYLDYKLRLHRYAPENGNISNYFPAAMFLTEEQISSIVSGNSPDFKLSADLSEFADDSACNLTIVDTRYDEGTPIASKENIHPGEIFQFASTNQVADPPSIENLAIDINIGEYPKGKGDDCTVSGFDLTGTN